MLSWAKLDSCFDDFMGFYLFPAIYSPIAISYNYVVSASLIEHGPGFGESP